MSFVLDPIRRFWRDHVVGPKPPTYDAACEELGGMPWRPATETDRWFLVNRPDPPIQRLGSSERLPVMDTGSFVLKRGFSDRTKLALLSSAAVLAIVIVVVLLAGGASAQPGAIVATSSVATAPASSIAQAPTAAAWSPSPAPANAGATVATNRTAAAPRTVLAARLRPNARRHIVARHPRR
jgi:hypothetical protein